MTSAPLGTPHWRTSLHSRQSVTGIATGVRLGRRSTLKTRLLYCQAVEVARCWEEGVIDDPREADLGAILGWGFAPWTGGPITLIDQTGLKAFVAKADELAAQLGDRFKVPQLLRDIATKGETFYGNFEGKQKAAA